MRYAFGDSEIAAQRLKLLAEVFADSSAPFLRETVHGQLGLALDLGCGPGYSTSFLADLLSCAKVAGLDSSERFITLARQRQTARVTFHLHDVTAVPFPVGPADLIYARFLLTHLRDPQATVERWATELCSHGLLLMEETEWIDTENSTFATYLRISEAMLASQSNTLHVGPILNGLAECELLARRSSAVRRLRVTNRSAATLFHMNIRFWRHHDFVQAHYSPATIDALQAELCRLSHEMGDGSDIEWGVRQLAFERV